MRALFTGVLLFALLGMSAPQVQAQIAVGPQVSAADDVDFGIGAVLDVPIPSLHEALEFAGAFTFFFPDHGDYTELEGTVRYLFHLHDSALVPFALAGMGVGFASHEHDGQEESETHVDLKFGGGIKAHMERLIPFAELDFGVGDGPDFTFRVGVALTLGAGGEGN